MCGKSIPYYQNFCVYTFCLILCYDSTIITYDSLIIGAGPAGVSAAIYLARFNRTVLVVDCGKGRSSYPQINHNYLGFPDGIAARELRRLGKEQAKKVGVTFAQDEIIRLSGQKGHFIAKGEQEYHAKTVVLATGVIDKFPVFERSEEYIGKSMFWCIVCDGFITRGKRIAFIGNNDEAAVTCLQFMNFTNSITMIANCEAGGIAISQEKQQRLKEHGIPLLDTQILTAEGTDGMVEKLFLSNGTALEIDYIFSFQGSNPACSLAVELGIDTTPDGYLKVDKDQRTSFEGIYAAGDLTRDYSHQLIAAAHEGSMAAQAINWDLYENWQK